jgi:hypothetical protein
MSTAQGLEEMQRLRVAMIPVDQSMAVNKRWGKIPLDELVAALNERAKDVVLRVDKPKPETQANVIELMCSNGGLHFFSRIVTLVINDSLGREPGLSWSSAVPSGEI